MAKPILVTLPAVLLLLDYWPLRRLMVSGGMERQRPAPRPSLEKLPLLIIAGLSSGVTLWAQQTALMPVEKLPLLARLANAAVAYMAYLGKFVWPVRLAVFYPMPRDGWPIWVVAAACGILAGISGAVFAVRRSHPYLLVGWLWYVGTLFPVIGIVQVGGQAMADRYTYLPQIGLSIAMIWYGAEFIGGESSRRSLACVAAGGVLVGLMGTAWRQTTHWHDSEALWNQTLANTSRNYVAYYNLGHALASLGHSDDAAAQYEIALAINPDCAEAHNNLGLMQASQGQIDAAMTHFQRVLQINPNCAEAHNNLGLMQTGRGQIDAAIVHYQRALEINPDFAEAHINFAQALAGLGRTNEAAAHYQKALMLKPGNADVHNKFGLLFVARGQIKEAIFEFQKALQLNPEYAIAHYNLGNALAGCKQFDAAIARYERAVDIQPDFVQRTPQPR